MKKQHKGSKTLWEKVTKVFQGRDDDYRNQSSIGTIFGNIGDLFRKATTSAKNNDRYTGIVFGAINAIADSFSSTPVRLYRKTGTERVEIDQHKALDFLNKPNDFMSGLDLKVNYASNIKISGNVYWVFIKDVDDKDLLVSLDPSRVKVVPSESGLSIAGYIYSTGKGQRIKLGTDVVTHFKTFNPINPFIGIGTIQAAAYDIDSNLATSVWNQTFFENSARPDVAIIMDENTTLDADDSERIKAEWNTKHQGIQNSHKMTLMQGAIKDIKNLQPTNRDMDFVNLKRMTRDEILAIFRVPKAIMAITEDVNRANAEAGAVVFSENTIKPLLRAYVDVLNNFYLAKFPGTENLFFDFDDPTPDNRELVLKEDTELVKTGILTVNEVRATKGLEPIEGGDEMRGSTPPSIAESIVEPKKELKDKVLSKIKGIDIEFERKGAIYQKEMVARAEKYYDRVKKASIDNFDYMEASVLANLKEATKTVKKSKLLNIRKAIGLWISTFNPIVTDIYKEEGQGALAFIGSGEIFDINNNAFKAELNKSLKTFSKGVVRTTIVKLERELNAGVALGEGIPKLRKRVQVAFKGMKASRAEMIARNEVLTASNQAQVNAWKQSGVVESKIWYTAEDERVCFVKNTKIRTTKGNKNIQDIKVGDTVKTPEGYQKVLKTMQRDYDGILVGIKAGISKTISTANHPFYANNQWHRADELKIGYVLQTVENESIKIDGIVNFKLSNSDSIPTILSEQGISASVFDGIMPKSTINLNGNLDRSDSEINTISTNPVFLDKRNLKTSKTFSNKFFDRCFPFVFSKTGKRTELSITRRRSAKSLSTGFTYNKNRRASTFLRTEMPIKASFGTKELTASLTAFIKSIRSTTLTRTNRIAMSNTLRDRKGFIAYWTDFSNEFSSFISQIAFITAKSLLLLPQIRVKSSTALLTSVDNSLISPTVPNLMHKSNNVKSNQLQYTTKVYNLEVDKENVYYANGVLVHNCSYCGPMHGKTVSVDVKFFNKGDQFLGEAKSPMKLDYRSIDAPPLHTSCRCTVLPVVSNKTATIVSKSEEEIRAEVIQELKNKKIKSEGLIDLKKKVEDAIGGELIGEDK